MTAEFKVLGPLEVRYQGGPIATPAGKVRVLLAALLLRANRVVTADELVELLWEDGSLTPARARATLHMVVTRLRRALGPANVVRTATGGYVADVPPDALDLHRFRALAADGRHAEALELWRGEPLADVPSDALHLAEVGPLLEERLAVLELRVDADLAAGRAHELVAELRALTGRHPLRERFWAQLMLALYRSDRQAEALAAYRTARDHLVRELGVEPGPRLQELHEHILIASPEPAPARAETVITTTPHLLPARSPHFVGRVEELARLAELAERQSGVVTIGGTAGVGKTTLAVFWANQVAERFPDGQLYLNLRGFDPTGEPVKPAEAIRSVLDAFGVAPQDIPTALDGQVVLYRSVLANRRLLLVLDNARDAEQVRPLLPGDSPCFVVVTSRDRLAGLVANEGASPVTLDLFSPEEGRSLLVRRLGASRVREDEEAALELVHRCAGLPLALAIVAARAVINPHFPLRVMADELAGEHHRLDYLDAGDPDASVRTVFSWSYRHLSPPAARLFRLVGRHPCVHISVPAAVALAGAPVGPTREAIGELMRAHLLFEHLPGRYSTYDLLRWYAAERSAAEDSEADRAAAVERVLSWYLHTGYQAKTRMTTDHVPPRVEPAPSVRPATFTSFEHACDWFEAEYSNFCVMAGEAFATRRWNYLPTMGTVSWNFLNMRSYWPEILGLGEMGLVGARELGDRLAEADTLVNLAAVCGRMGRFEDSISYGRRALEVAEPINSDRNMRKALNNLGMAYTAIGRNDEAIGCLLRALEICHAQEGRPGEAILLDTLATIYRAHGELARALTCLDQALRLNLRADDRYSAGINLANLGLIHQELGAPEAAASALEQALDHSRAVADRHNQAVALSRLGDVRHELGDVEEARRCWRDALDIFKELNAPEMRAVGDRLLARAGA
ncbi:BTAD domain-containing putative transcriptional regulator [Actinosynnema sp. NPDC020468]|uniref:AfsR/SARP family transcriptional regulator n=1 Tax=Actinosynnema sp. NPDC020468 TaxID=3154488 RepID=UPI00340C3DF8